MNDLKEFNSKIVAEEINPLLNNIQGSPKDKCPKKETFFLGTDNYVFERRIYKDQYIISILYNSPQKFFCWMIDIEHDGDISKLQEGVNITGYSHRWTDVGTSDEFKKILQEISHLFPEKNPHNYEMCTAKQSETHLKRFFPAILRGIPNVDFITHHASEILLVPKLKNLESGNYENKEGGDSETNALVAHLKNVYPTVTIEKFSYNEVGAKGIKLLIAEIPKILSAAAEHLGSLTWKAAKVVAQLPPEKTDKKLPIEMSDLVNDIRSLRLGFDNFFITNTVSHTNNNTSNNNSLESSPQCGSPNKPG